MLNVNQIQRPRILLSGNIFAITLFTSSALLFVLEPMFARMVLPVLGGTPAVWNSCMVFYQAALLAGYLYANLWTSPRITLLSAIAQVGVLVISVMILPIGLPAAWSPPIDHNPIPWLFLMLTVAVGLPFFALATLTPALQKWFANTRHRSADDPYFLYAASNFGSLAGLLSYPILIEPNLGLREQSLFWAYGYWLLIIMTGMCALVLWRSSVTLGQSNRESTPIVIVPILITKRSTRPPVALRLRWIALAFAPASLMLSVTTLLTTEIPPIPLFWVAPLSVYLLSFILVFAKKQIVSHSQMVERLPFLILAALIPVFSKAGPPVWIEIALNLTALFVAAMVCHGELANSRPSADHLTQFYLWISVGGVLGGLFNAFVAPLTFSALQEFPLALILVALLRPCLDFSTEKAHSRWTDWTLPFVLGVWVLGCTIIFQQRGLKPGPLLHLAVFAPAMLLCLSFAKRPLRFAVGLGVLFVASSCYSGPYGHILYRERSFFGIYRVTDNDDGRYRLLFHGSTNHGMQSLTPADRLRPLSYYTRSGPIGQVFDTFEGTAILQHVAIIGLGAGSLACYGDRGQQFTFYEIDPVVERIASDPRYFTFLRDCAPNIDIILGDARLSLNKARNRSYGLIIVDAFGSDAIPVHLLTREAIDLYFEKLTDNGVLVFHISNRYLELWPVLGAAAKEAGSSCFGEDDTNITEAEIRNGKFPSRWVVMARAKDDLGTLTLDPRWTPIGAPPKFRVWRDDFSSILRAIKWD